MVQAGLWMGTSMAVLGVLVIFGIVMLVKTLFNTLSHR